MFDIGFTELLLIAVVALLVLGPERLPKAARFAGLWVRRARAQWSSVKAELEHELAADELKRNLHETQAAMREAQASLREAGKQARRELDEAGDGLMRGPALPAAVPDAVLDAEPADTGADDDQAGSDVPGDSPDASAQDDDDVRR